MVKSGSCRKIKSKLTETAFFTLHLYPALMCNADLQNGYNYNIDLRYELFEKNGDMLSITAYYKHLKAPIERVQTLSGGSAVHSFRNADNGMATEIGRASCRERV